MEQIKFDYIVGNPPYNKGIVKKHHTTYNHPAMNASKEAYLGFYLKCHTLLKDTGHLMFVTPGKWLIGPSCKAFRSWFAGKAATVHALGLGEKVFGHAVAVDEVVVTHIKPDNSSIYVTTGDYTYEWRRGDYPHDIIPKFTSEEQRLAYLKAAERGTFDPNTSIQAGDNSGPLKDVSDIQTASHPNPVLVGRVIKYTSIRTSTSDKWRVIIKKCYARWNSFQLLQPGVEHDYTWCGVICDTEGDAKTLLGYLQSDLVQGWWEACRSSRHSYPILACMPRPE